MSERVHATEDQSRALTEASRETTWAGRSFMGEMFLGNFRFDWIDPFPQQRERPAFRAFYDKLDAFLENTYDELQVDRDGVIPQAWLDALAEMGAMGMKIPVEYGGLGLSQYEYGLCLERMGEVDGNLIALLSAHQSIGVPTPVKLFGTAEQKAEFLPRCAAGELTAFALTEEDVGSDPARLATTLTRTDDGEHYILSGRKLWITNGTIAKLMVVMARHADSGKISAIVVDTASKGVSVERRCHFMGLKALENGVICFDEVKVPVKNRIGDEGRGLKVALVTLNTGRLSLPAGCAGGNRRLLQIARDFAGERVQWGHPVGKHEAIAHKLTDLAALTWTMESMTRLCSLLADRQGYDIRLEAAAAKEWGSTRNWDSVDETLQIRGGRGFETADSLAARGERPIALEKAMRDVRINRIFEGSSEIMHLFMAREALDPHLKAAGPLVDKKAGFGEKLAALPSVIAFYAKWYPTLWVAWGYYPKYVEHGELATHLRYADRATRRLARNVFHGMVRYQAGLERKQAFLFRAVEIGIEIFAMASAVARARSWERSGHKDATKAVALADQFCLSASRRIDQWFKDLWKNDDAEKTAFANRLLAGDFAFLEPDSPLPEAPATSTDEAQTAAK
ncbi:MAG: acyl-CoA dehydrogenase family protein [Proteobacteria bacterium]|nr:acyl-CoA dehydrogenase family protein [Pseudomonadota bacterium]